MTFKYSLHSLSQALLSGMQNIKYIQQSFAEGSSVHSGLQHLYISKKDLLHKVLLIISNQLTFSTSSMLEMLTEPFMREKCVLVAAMRVTYKSGVSLGF